MRSYLAALAKNRRKSSIGRKLAALKKFFRYLVATHKIEKDPLLLIHSPKQEKPLPAFLSVDDAFHLLGAVKLKTGLDVRDLAVLDRKSTRLNSSHSQISYAVFCLKK